MPRVYIVLRIGNLIDAHPIINSDTTTGSFTDFKTSDRYGIYRTAIIRDSLTMADYNFCFDMGTDGPATLSVMACTWNEDEAQAWLDLAVQRADTANSQVAYNDWAVRVRKSRWGYVWWECWSQDV